MSYGVKEAYVTLQGEGAHTGRRAVFLRFAGCNLWTGREQDRAEAQCQFCDTDFVGLDGPGGGRFDDPAALAAHVETLWGTYPENRYVVCTGGEPLLQLDEPLIEALHALDFEVGVETNGTQPRPAGLDWVCVSPKAGTEVVLRSGDELKLVYPQPGLLPPTVEDWDFAHRFVQPMDGPEAAANTIAATEWCLANPKWRLSLQTHKLIGIP